MPPSKFGLNAFDSGVGTLLAHLHHNGRKRQIKPIATANEPTPNYCDRSPLSRIIPLTLRRYPAVHPQREIGLIHAQLATGTGARYNHDHGNHQQTLSRDRRFQC